VDQPGYEVVIIGSGPAGLAAAVRAARRGISHLVLERSQLASTIARYRRGKWVMAEPSAVALHADLGLEFEADTRERVLSRWERDCERAGVQIRSGPAHEVVSIDGAQGAFRIHTAGGDVHSARNVVLAIGTAGAPRPFEVPGDGLPHVVFEIEDASAYVDRQIVIVGAGDSAIEDALALAACDNDVALVQRRAGFDRAKPANKSAVEAAIRRGEIREYAHSTVSRFEPYSVWIDTPEGEVFLESDLVIGRLGARPPRRFLESLGVRFDSPDPEALPCVSETYESDVPGLYLVGELVGRPLIKHCLNQGYEVIEHILGHPVASAEEPLLRQVLAPIRAEPQPFMASLRKSVPAFAALSARQLEAWLVDSSVHVLPPGKVVYHEGDFGESLFTILEGAVELWSEGPEAEASSGTATEAAEREPSLLRQGEFFGEDALFSGRGRSEGARTVTRSVLLETSRAAALRVSSSVADLRAELDRCWAVRKLGALLPELDREECSRLTDAAALSVYEPGEALFHEGEPADGLHLIRRGSVVVLRERGGTDRVVNHVSAGSTLGEFALVRPSGLRTATVRATVRTESLCIPTARMQDITERFPELRAHFRRRWREHTVRDERLLATPGSTSMLDFVIAQGGKEATDLLYIDESMCIRCDNCEKACAATHDGVSRLDREAGPRFADIHLPTSCQHCENPNCMSDCPPGAIQRHPDGEIYIDDTCIGCGNCAAYCGYGVIKLTELPGPRSPGLLASILFGRSRGRRRRPTGGNVAHEVAVKCDLCRDLRRRSGSPVACVAACPTGAMDRISPAALLRRISGRSPRTYPVEESGGVYAARGSR